MISHHSARLFTDATQPTMSPAFAATVPHGAACSACASANMPETRLSGQAYREYEMPHLSYATSHESPSNSDAAYFGEGDRPFRERDRFERSVLSCVGWIVGREGFEGC